MTKFDRNSFYRSGDYLQYFVDDKSTSKFIARFKYGKKDLAGFKSFLIKNFTVEEYLERLSNGEGPVKILESKGYVSKTVADIITRYGFPATREGFDAYIQQQIKNRA